MKLPVAPYPPSSVTLAMWPSMPDDYRKVVVRIMAVQAYAEAIAAPNLALWISRAPGFRVVRSVARILADEARHAFLLYRVLEALGISEKEAIAIAEGKGGSGASKSQSLEGPLAVAAPENEWIDVVLNCMFLDRAGRLMVGNFAQSSFAPWASACKAILKEEDMHIGFGLTGFRRFLKEDHDRDKLARQVTRWYAYGLNFFGPPAGPKDARLFDFGLKRKSNEALRQEYVAEVAEALRPSGQDLIRLSTDAYPYR